MAGRTGSKHSLLSKCIWNLEFGSTTETSAFGERSKVSSGGIVLAFSEKTALGSRSRLGAHGMAREPVRQLTHPSRPKKGGDKRRILTVRIRFIFGMYGSI